ncbi:MAG TPA: DNA translocase FtsK 4TM domain-containing protein [Candidatus Saccharimonadales bacterium]|nr:DNA translocase FtsK 4TM domain-containing protein [Candidatus Saccharimonadales bacterium]
MAKRKKSIKKIDKTESKSSVFWPTAGAVLLILVALFLLIGGFHAGGPLPKSMFNGVFWTLGWTAYLAPIALVFFGVLKFSDENHEIPLNRLVGMISFLVINASWFFVTFASRVNPSVAYSGGHGGKVGSLIGAPILNVIDKIPASILLFVVSWLLLFFALNISPRAILKVFSIFKGGSPSDEDTDLASLKAKALESNFKLNEGVPVEHNQQIGDSSKASGFRNAAAKLVSGEEHEALTTSGDPDWQFPSIDLLNQKQDSADAGDIKGNVSTIKQSFSNFNLPVEMEGANIGPRVTQYTLKPPTGVKLTKITALENNLALDLAAHSIRIEAPIPGKKLVGIEVPNIKPAMVRISSLLQSQPWEALKSPLGFVIGKDIAGLPIVGDLASMPHLLIAGQTGSGKSVMINSILTSLVYRDTPSDLKLILIDPKQVELTPYNEIPHLLTPVIHEPEKCISALKWAVAEMDRRLKAMAEIGGRNIVEYNNRNKDERMPYIVIVIDELADLMMLAARDVEHLIVRLAQKARASGIHLVLATQRPSVDVITGLIKANVPARIAFTTASQVDSRTIIDQIGSEKLLGQGDMLLLTAEMPKPKRVQGAFIAHNETLKVTDFLRSQRPPQYNDEVISQPVQLNGKGGIVADYSGEVDDNMWRDAIAVVIEGRKASTSLLQRRLRIGYGRAARLIEQMEEQGIVGHADGNRPRDVLVRSVDEVFAGREEASVPEVDDRPEPVNDDSEVDETPEEAFKEE